MNNSFGEDEKLYRAVYKSFWKKDGTLSPSAFLSKEGLSVDRGYYREDHEVVEDMAGRLNGVAVSVDVGMCSEVDAVVLYKPTVNMYHSEIHGSHSNVVLSPDQRLFLAKGAKTVGEIPKKQ